MHISSCVGHRILGVGALANVWPILGVRVRVRVRGILQLRKWAILKAYSVFHFRLQNGPFGEFQNSRIPESGIPEFRNSGIPDSNVIGIRNVIVRNVIVKLHCG